jgi:hypothetical protein
MTNWATFLGEIRVDLKDTGTAPRFSDDALYLWAKDAIRDYSMHYPKRMDRVTLTAVGGAYPLPADYYQDVEVEYPLNTFLERRQQRPGKSYSVGSTPTSYYISGGKLHLDVASPSYVIYLTYDAIHPSPAAHDDNTFVLTIPMPDEELIRLYIKAKASEQLRTQQASLDRFKLGSGDRQDNPLLPEVNTLMVEYRTKLAERYPGKTIRFWKPTRR